MRTRLWFGLGITLLTLPMLALGLTVPLGTWQPVERAEFTAKYAERFPKTVPTRVTLEVPTTKIHVTTMGTVNTSHCTLDPYSVQVTDSSGTENTHILKRNEATLKKPVTIRRLGLTFSDFASGDGVATRCGINVMASAPDISRSWEQNRKSYKQIGSIPYKGGFVKALDHWLPPRTRLKRFILEIPETCKSKMQILEAGIVSNDRFQPAHRLNKDGHCEFVFEACEGAPIEAGKLRIRLNGKYPTKEDPMACPITVHVL